MIESQKSKLYARQKGLCWICCRPMRLDSSNDDPWLATVDHINPVSRNGVNKPRNKLLAHKICNQIRGNPQPKVRVQLIIARAMSRIAEAAQRHRVQLSGGP